MESRTQITDLITSLIQINFMIVFKFHLSALSTLGKNAVVIGRSHNVGLPVHILLSADASKGGLELTSTLCHRHTPPPELARAVSRADLVVSAAGVGSLVTRDMVSPGAVVIDVGLSRREGRLVGDCDLGVREVRRTLYMSPATHDVHCPRWPLW